MLWGEWLTLNHHSTYGDCLYKIEKARKHFFGELACREGRWGVESSIINLTVRFWIASRMARECLEAPLHESQIHDKSGFESCMRSCRSVKNHLNLNKKPISFAVDFATEEMCPFQDRSDATETPNIDSLRGIRANENVREIFILAPRN